MQAAIEELWEGVFSVDRTEAISEEFETAKSEPVS
jgi:hypothetical protein